MRRSALKITRFTQQTAAVRKTAAARFHRQQHNEIRLGLLSYTHSNVFFLSYYPVVRCLVKLP